MHATLGLLQKFAPTVAQAHPTGEAFAIVRRMLQERPRHFREILADGIASTTPEGDDKPVAYKMKKSKGKGKAEVESIAVPEGHPFMSGTFLKKRIIPVLESQNLVRKAWLDAVPGSSLAKMSHHQRKHAMWVIQEEGKLAERWDAITDPSLTLPTLRRLGAEERAAKAEAAVKRREAAFNSGREERTERDIMAWADRPVGFTTSLERKHLNTRRARARPIKEALVAERAVVKAEVAKALEADKKTLSKIASRVQKSSAAAVEKSAEAAKAAAEAVEAHRAAQAAKEKRDQELARRRKAQSAEARKANRAKEAEGKAEGKDKVPA
ncbi:hypothetical protein CC85DRAFT_282545 [Cutaneotrichosporon oleaginosum]|uniref:Uncharacterized protein n=1 Tax=Cutaneotrichosporon oleaginosum TaxID=879819 RepID=A0A0J0XWP5_9TREE|nr:uncharacterized protein CC85DRAFT_282545 [Cutaneotrichosporon oleaginosum]KLT45463.1 hypothetical protein CC85DRAFT_282545 [Cutaneotrichosporon oleaginosum]TXT14581.1 hypothetical protein COLE_00774 [Cutaneotrichosporon oleaginosum]